MGKIIILVRDNEDYDYIYGNLIIKSNVFDVRLFQKRLDDMRDELGYEDANGTDVVNAVIERYDEYSDVEFVGIATDELFV